MVDLTSNFSKIVFHQDVNIKNFVIDPINEKIYFANEKFVYRMSFDGSDEEMLYVDQNTVIQELAFDWIGRNMFWVSSSKSMITDENQSFSYKLTLPVNKRNLSSLIIDPVAG